MACMHEQGTAVNAFSALDVLVVAANPRPCESFLSRRRQQHSVLSHDSWLRGRARPIPAAIGARMACIRGQRKRQPVRDAA